MTKQKFNWTGITDNGDGTFSTEGKIEKRRLLKSLHSSGYKVRSHKNADGSWTVSPIGAMRATRRRPVVGGFRPRYRAQQQGRYVPIGRMQKYHRRYGPAPRPRVYPVGYSGSYPRQKGISLYQRHQLYKSQKAHEKGLSEQAKRETAKEQKGTVSIKGQAVAFQTGKRTHPSDESYHDYIKRARLEESALASRRQRELGESAIHREKLKAAVHKGYVTRTSQLPAEPAPPKEGIYGIRRTTEINQAALQEAREKEVT